MPERQFLVTNNAEHDNSLYRAFTGSTFSEAHLREWANDRWGTPMDASLDVIARDIQQGGWMLLEYIEPAEADPKTNVELAWGTNLRDDLGLPPASEEKQEPGTIKELGPGTPSPHPD